MKDFSTASLSMDKTSGFLGKADNSSVRGALFKGLSCLCFSGIYGCVRYLALTANELGIPPLPATEVVFFETLFGLLFILPWALSTGMSAFKATHHLLYLARVLVVCFGTILWFMALSKMPIVQVVAFKYITPLFTLLGAKIFLSEKCGWGRGLAIGVTFVGAFLITGNKLLESGVQWMEISYLAIFPLGAVVCHALSAVFGKKQAKNDSPQTISLYLLLLAVPILGFASSLQWVTPLSWHWPWFVLMGGLLAGAYIFLSQAYAIVDITYLIPVSFIRLIAAAVIGMVFFSEWPTFWIGLGSFFILGATAVLCQYESQQSRQAKAEFKRQALT
jgi:drug/metabolite transporter (DMT)-like permease